MLRTDSRLGLLDTSPDAERVMYSIYAAMPAWRKLQLVEDANRTCRLLALAGLRSRHPSEPESRLHRRLFGLVLGEDLATRVFGPLSATP